MTDPFFWILSIPIMFAGFLISLLLVVFWVWMLVDCAQRKFRKDWEKAAWILAIVFLTWVGALVYFIVIRSSNPRGVLIK